MLKQKSGNEYKKSRSAANNFAIDFIYKTCAFSKLHCMSRNNQKNCKPSKNIYIIEKRFFLTLHNLPLLSSQATKPDTDVKANAVYYP